MANTIEIVISAKNVTGKAFAALDKSLVAVTKIAKRAGIAIAGLTASLFAIAKSTSAAGDQFQKMAQRVGVSAQALSELSFAAELSGASIANVETGLKLLSKRMLDANQGLAEASRTFASLNIAITDSSGNLRAADEVFMDAVEALNSLSSETEKVALAQELFGRSGAQLLPLIKSGSDGIEAMRKEAEQLGITFNDLEAQQSADFEDALTRVSSALKGVRNTIGKELIPVLTVFATNLSKSIKNIIPAIKEFAIVFASVIGNLPQITQDTVKLISDLFNKFFTDFEFFKSFFVGFSDMLAAMLKGTSNILLQMTQIVLKVSSIIWVPLGEAFTLIASNIRFGWQILVNNLAEITTKSAIAIAEKLNTILPEAFEFDISGLKGVLAEIEKEIIKPPKTMEQAFDEGSTIIRDLFSSIGDDVNEISKETIKAFQIIKNVAKEFVGIPEVEEFLDKTLQSLNKFSEKGSAAIAEGLGTTDEQVANTKTVWDELREHIQQNLIEISDVAVQTWDTFQKSVGDAFADVIVSGESMVTAFENLLRNVARAVISSLVQMAIQKAVFGQTVKAANSAEASSTLATDGAQTFSGAFASVISALPYPANIAAAPGVAAGALSAVIGGATGAAAAGAATGAGIGQADDGMIIPRRGTFMLDQGERVVSVDTNRDLKEAIETIKKGGSGGGLIIKELNIMPDSSINEALLNQPREFWLKAFKRGILPAMNELGSNGLTTTMQSRKGRI